jgi:hypothetical protein
MTTFHETAFHETLMQFDTPWSLACLNEFTDEIKIKEIFYGKETGKHLMGHVCWKTI